MATNFRNLAENVRLKVLDVRSHEDLTGRSEGGVEANEECCADICSSSLLPRASVQRDGTLLPSIAEYYYQYVLHSLGKEVYLVVPFILKSVHLPRLEIG